jgi:hypothetical protein
VGNPGMKAMLVIGQSQMVASLMDLLEKSAASWKEAATWQAKKRVLEMQ